jgi:6-phosphogluconolactonase
MGQVRVFADAAELAQAAAGKIAQRIIASMGVGGRCSLVLSGGHTPIASYQALAAGPWLDPLKWRAVDVYFADERAVPPDHPESNYGMARAALIEPAGIPAKNVHRIRAEDPDLEQGVREYESALPAVIDLIILGIGADGHTASIFPGSPVAREALARVAAVRDSPKPPLRRITITPRVFREAREIMVLATGASKAEAVARALEGTTDPDLIPARLVREREWLLDRAAARLVRNPEEPRTA